MTRKAARQTPFGPPGARDWLLLVISLLFCAVALWEIVGGRDWRTGTLTLFFFGGGALLFAGRIITGLRQSRADIGQVAIAGSRDIPMARGRMLALVGAVGAFGVAGVVLGQSMGLILQALCAGLAVFAAGFAIAVLCGWLPATVLRFEPQGLVIQRGAKRRYRVDWDNIAGVSVGEIGRSSLILLQFHDAAAVALLPGADRRAVQREIATTRGLYGADHMIMPKVFGLDAQLLTAALERYIRTPAARAQLGKFAALN